MNRQSGLVITLVLVASACSGNAISNDEPDAVSTTSIVAVATTETSASTATAPPTTTVQSTTTSPQTTTQQTTAEETTTTTPVDLPPALAAATFAFASGTTPRISILVAVGETPNGPWIPAGFGSPDPILTGPSYWVQFTIANLDSLGTVTDVELSGESPDAGPLGTDICELASPLGVGEQTTCVVGGDSGFAVDGGGAEHFFTAVGTGFRQGIADEVYFDPPIPDTVDYAGAPHSFILVFETVDGLRIDGVAHTPDIAIGFEGLDLSQPVRVDCSDDFPSGVSATGGSPTASEPHIVAFVAVTFDSNGSRLNECAHIPKVDLDFELDGGSNDSYSYVGG